ncbi:hypothetical protein TVAG_228130 [Trichomonas vaginalis G3]|uniref:Uncharacterized protein n=1 Tax=Trichomonas vaginalis (strain ATCC PRA-98 / G3) TaxID=412133 RepID=A2DIX6_TRIV3|nr:hypothetical protein TVAGG3_0483390 [Trichomonas vaginalis G3]EAY19551.1 hypothetical protein TVAG_228130 [Trichomonas vaginalis G3]KAI5515868.1 hypothetical protein TVAGG3_0483390 [Trichomonas vaginalis G3]|eukprot:XP_001580537.1 hypothetical protein [Trichomonas vaginalis G3]
MDINQKLRILICEWAAVSLFGLLRDIGLKREQVLENLEANLDYINDFDCARIFKKIPEDFNNLSTDDIRMHQKVIELHINTFLTDRTRNLISSSVANSIQNIIVFASRTIKPNKAVKRERTYLKSGIYIPKTFYSYIQSMLDYLNSFVKQTPKEDLVMLHSSVFELLINVLMKRKQRSGTEGAMINLMSVNVSISTGIWDIISNLAQMKCEPKVQNLFLAIVKNVESFRCVSKETMKNMVQVISQLKGSWALLPICSFVTRTFSNAYENEEENYAVECLATELYPVLYKYANDNPNDEWLTCLFLILKISDPEKTGSTVLKIANLLNKNYTNLGGMNYFKLAGLFFEALVDKSFAQEITQFFWKSWFDKNGNANSQYANDMEYWILIAPKMHFCAPIAFMEFLEPIIQVGETHPLFEKIINAIHVIITIKVEYIEGITMVLAPFLKGLNQKSEISKDLFKLFAPLLPIIWKYESSLRDTIISLLGKMINNTDIAILANCAIFITDVLENYPIGTLGIETITSFAENFLKRTQYDVSIQQLLHILSSYYLFFKGLLFFGSRGIEVIDSKQWRKILFVTETILITFSFFPSDKVKSIIQDIWNLTRSPLAQERSTNQLSLKIKDISMLPVMCLNKNMQSYIEEKYIQIITFFISLESSNFEFKLGLAKYLFTITRPEYFISNEKLQIQGINRLLMILSNLEQEELCILLRSVPLSIWPVYIHQMMNISDLNPRLKFKFANAMSVVIKFKDLTRENERLRNSFVELVKVFLNLPMPSNENQQKLDVLASEFYATFIRANSEVIKDHPFFKDPYSHLNNIIQRLNPDSITLPDISHVFSILELVHSYVDTWKLTDDAMEEIIDWTTFIALKTKGSILLQLKCHELLQSLVEKNQDNLSTIISCCFRTSIFTTSHVAAAIVRSNSEPLYKAILALGLCSKGNIVCRALAAEIANSSFGGEFSPLCYLDPFFEERVVDFFNNNLDEKTKELVFTFLPEIVGKKRLHQNELPHFNFISTRFRNITSNFQVEKLLNLTSITDFTDLSPIKPLICLWDNLFKSNSIRPNEVFEFLLSKVDSVTNTKILCAVCIAFHRSFLINSKATSQYLCSKLRIIKDPKMTFDNFVPTPIELATSACMSYIYTLEDDVQRFNVCWMDKIQFILSWAIFLRFNPLYESYMIPPLLISVSHAAVPSSDLNLFVMKPSNCVANNVILPFRYRTEFTTSQMEMLLMTLKKFSLLTAELFLDVCADKATSLTKYSSDFWTLFSNFFQPRHSSEFLNGFMNAAQAGDLATVGLMLPILTGVVRQNATAEHIGGFAAVIIFVMTYAGNHHFLKLIVKHLPVFVETVKKSNDAGTITTTFEWIMKEHGGEECVVEGVLKALSEADSLHSPLYTSSLIFLHEVVVLIAISGSKFSLTSAILFLFDSIRRIETKGLSIMVSQDILNFESPNNYEELTDILRKYWSQRDVTYVCTFLLTWAGASAIPVIPGNAFTILRIITQNWTDAKYMQSVKTLGTVISHMMIAATEEKIKLMQPDITKILTTLNVDRYDLPDVVCLVRPLVERTKGKKSADPSILPQIMTKHEREYTVVEVCEFIKDNILE